MSRMHAAIIYAINSTSQGDIMTALSIRNLDEEALKRLKTSAQQEGSSVNTLVVRLIETATGLRPTARASVEHHELDTLAGTWSEADALAFNEATAAFEQPDAVLWR
jgi:plasmid stability protein